MSSVHLVGGEKGGVGKSVVARTLAQYFIDKGLSFAALDADNSHGALLRYYADYTRAVDLEQLDSADQIMDRALGAERSVVVDLPAQSTRYFRRWANSGDVLSFAPQMGVELYFWHVSDGGYDSVRVLEGALEEFRGQLKFVVVKNYGRSQEFEQLEESKAATELREQGGHLIDFPGLNSRTMYMIDGYGASFWAAVNSQDPELALSPMERQRTKLWLARAYEGIDTVIAR